MSLVLTLLSLTAIVAVWTVIVRPWLRDKPWMQWFFANPVVEWIEIHVYRKSETLLWARWFQLMGAVAVSAGYLGGIDWTIFAPVIPEKWLPFLPMIPLALNFIATIAEAQRRDTSEPLSVVSLPQVVSQEVASAVDALKTAKIEAVSVVKKEEATAAVLPPTVGPA